MKKMLVILTFCLSSWYSFAGVNESWDTLLRSAGSSDSYPDIVQNLISDGFYYSSIPFIKEYLIRRSTQVDARIDIIIDDLVTNVGIKQFEVLPLSVLNKSNAPILRYILGKKLFRVGKYKEAMAILKNGIPAAHPTKPFSLLLEASIASILGDEGAALSLYQDCVLESDKAIKEVSDNSIKGRQLRINRDYCSIGKPRTLFASKKYAEASIAYQTLSKASDIWPEILVEEAWNSFYQQDYNRTLGKLVTYKFPMFDFIYNPEIDVLRALTYLELCLYDDAKKVIEEFQKGNEKDYAQLDAFLIKTDKDYKSYYNLTKAAMAGTFPSNPLLTRILKEVAKDPTTIEIYEAFGRAAAEIEKMKEVKNSEYRRILTANLKDSLRAQRDLIGAYVRKKMLISKEQTDRALQDMSSIKLEMLKYRKESILNLSVDSERSRGDLKNVKRQDWQYFWNFNSEFWADELGDYVFSLKSECGVKN